MNRKVKDFYKLMLGKWYRPYRGHDYPAVVWSPTQGLHGCMSYDEIWFKSLDECVVVMLRDLLENGLKD